MRLTFTEDENRCILALLDELTTRYSSAENPEFLHQANVYAHELPWRIRLALNDFRLLEPASAICRITGYPVDDERIGPTPAHWKERQVRCVALREEMLLVLLGSLLGDLIAWSTQQDGALVHDIAPIKGHEGEQLGSGSEEELSWHTEDAFHPYRGDYLGMMCLRNPERVPTTFAALNVSALDRKTVDLLFEPLYSIRPDQSHLRKNRVAPVGDEVLEAAHRRIDQMNTRPEKIGLLFGCASEPYCRLDPYFMDPPEDPEARRVQEEIIRLISSSLEDVVLEAGEFCFIDNFKAVHGRRPFRARFNGTDRWLKRVNITRDLRRSRPGRRSPESRLLL